MAKSENAPNSMYLRAGDFKNCKLLDLAEPEPQDIGPRRKATTVHKHGQEAVQWCENLTLIWLRQVDEPLKGTKITNFVSWLFSGFPSQGFAGTFHTGTSLIRLNEGARTWREWQEP
jgi:hypothetical protein